MKLLIIEDTNKYKIGKTLEFDECEFIKEGLLHNNNFLEKNKYVILREELTPEDLQKISVIIDRKLVKMFWRLYTKSKFILQ